MSFEMFVFALTSLRANLLRTILTMLGILIGVASIIAIVAVGNGGKSAIVSTIESNRAQNTIQIVPSEVVQPGIPQPGQVLGFSQSDFGIARQFQGVQSVYYTLYGQSYITGNGKTLNASIDAGPSYLNEIGRFDVVSGRMFTDAEVTAHRPVILLSQPLANQLFPNQNPLGKVVRIDGLPLQVIGVTVSTQINLLSNLFGTLNMYMPATTLLDIYPYWNITEMDIQVNPIYDKSEIAKRIVTALNIHAHSAKAFEDSTGFYQGIEKTINTVTTILTLVVGAIAGIALFVGGVGVMNIMLVSVTERTEEIGIRMSLGASRRDILLQFLIESVTITGLGGGMGIVLGLLGASIVSWTTHLQTTVSLSVVVGSFLFSGFIGVVCGLYPANKASRLNPIDALRYE